MRSEIESQRTEGGNLHAEVVTPGTVLTCTRARCKTVNRW